MNLPPLQPYPVTPRPHWTESVSHEMAKREKFQKIGWFAPNHKPKTKIITMAKKLRDKYVICGCRLCLRGVTVRMTDGVLSGIVGMFVLVPIRTFWKASITTLNPGLIGSTVQLRRRRTIVLLNTRMAVPSLQRPGQAADGLLHYRTSVKGTTYPILLTRK
jgi:hypothetical protein